MPLKAFLGRYFFGHYVGVERAAFFVDVAAVGRGVGDDDLAAEVLEELRGDGGCGTVGAVNYDAVAVEGEAGDGGEEKLDVFGAVGFVDGGSILRSTVVRTDA